MQDEQCRMLTQECPMHQLRRQTRVRASCKLQRAVVRSSALMPLGVVWKSCIMSSKAACSAKLSFQFAPVPMPPARGAKS